jgi:hypothetical protein
VSNDEIFDPEIHAVDKDGNPSLNKDGSFRKKRRDAGGRSARSTSTRSKSSAGAAKAPSDRERYAKGVRDALAIPTMGLAIADPVDGYCAAELSPMFADAVAGVAVENPQLAAVCEKLAAGGAIGNLVGVTLLIGVQFGHNHGLIPENIARMAGATPRREIERLLKQRGEQLAERAAETPREHPQHQDQGAQHVAAAA